MIGLAGAARLVSVLICTVTGYVSTVRDNKNTDEY
jgi:hypothetical protein